jgi:hypothetical protein
MACHHAWVHAEGWIRTAKLTFFAALGFVRFVGEHMQKSTRTYGDSRGLILGLVAHMFLEGRTNASNCQIYHLIHFSFLYTCL